MTFDNENEAKICKNVDFGSVMNSEDVTILRKTSDGRGPVVQGMKMADKHGILKNPAHGGGSQCAHYDQSSRIVNSIYPYPQPVYIYMYFKAAVARQAELLQ